MKVFFDTEFTGLHKNTTLLSIGLVAENGRTFYAEFTDYDTNQMNDWLEQNVISRMTWKGQHDTERIYTAADDGITMLGDKGYVASRLADWLEKLNSPVELVSDCCHYDMVLFIDIFGGAFEIPACVCPACYDINQDIAQYLNISAQEAFDMSREGFLRDHNIKVSDDNKHNALFDARVIWAIYSTIKNG